MTASELLRAALIPLSNTSVLLTAVMFWLLLSLAAAAGMLGVWLAIVIFPALFRYLNSLVENVANGRDPKPPGTEFFRWIGETWSLLPLLLVIALGVGAWTLHEQGSTAAMYLMLVVAGLLYPAVLGVLAITHSPLQAISPKALQSFIGRIGVPYVIAPGFLLFAVIVSSATQSLPYIALLIQLLLIFSLHAVIGQLAEPHRLVADVYIPDDVEVSEEERLAHLEKARTDVLTHAYAFVSRGNRDGGFNHITQSIEQEANVSEAWSWYFERILNWEQKQHAMFFAQLYIHDMLRHGEEVPALKAILRCRLIDDSFKPLAEDLPRAIAAAANNGNNELATVLKRV